MSLKKLRFLISLIICFAIFPFTSCITEEENGPASGQTDDVAYMAVSIVFSDNPISQSTRAHFDGDQNVTDRGYFFNNGVDAESRICEEQGANWLLAYNASNQLIATLPLDFFSSDDVAKDNTGRNFTAVCEVSQAKDLIANISYFRIILNASASLQSQLAGDTDPENMTLSQSEAGNIDYLFRVSGADKFNTMSSSMVVTNGRRATAVTMSDVKLYPSRLQAIQSPCATLYVERLQTKYTVLFHPQANSVYDQFFFENRVWNYHTRNEISSEADNNVIYFTPSANRRVYYVNSFNVEDEYPSVSRGYWKASIVGWAINGTEKSEYLFKNFGNNPSAFNGWNFTPTGLSSPVRNLWASDPHYSDDKNSYPDQYRDAFDDESSEGDVKIFPYEGNESSYPLNYISFSNLSKRAVRQYSAENTYDAVSVFNNDIERLNNRLQYRCGNHLIVGAQLLIEGFDDNSIYNATAVDNAGLLTAGTNRVKTKYFMDNIYWDETAYINYFCKHIGNYMDATTPCISDLTLRERFIPNDVFTPDVNDAKFYVREGSGWRLADARDFTIRPVYIVGGDGWCYPFPKTDATGSNTILYAHQANGSYRQITAEEYDKLAYGYPFYFAKCYNQGRMYYAMPISGSSDQSAMRFGLTTGDFGAVRNHWYHYRFTGITSVGIPIHNPDQPIVPNNEPSVLGLGFEVRIVPWHIVEENVKI